MTTHIYPVNDIYPHETETYASEDRQCACRPKITWEGLEAIIVHHSFDDREAWDQSMDFLDSKFTQVL
jgi:hypothetical protein